MSQHAHSLMRSRIWSTLQLATHQEISDGLAFYPGAHGLCRLLAHISTSPRLTPSHIAGIYAALSPMNTWDTNVANIIDILRYGSGARVNTTGINRDKAVRISQGEDPGVVLGGSKVRAFWKAIADPTDTHPIAIDRHLINCALGLVNPTKREQGDLANDRTLYSRIEAVYYDLGRREEVGNRLASVVWFVQRRLSRSGQRPVHDHGSTIPLVGPVCCGRTMHGHGPRQFRCPTCRSTIIPTYRHRLTRTPDGWRVVWSTDGLPIWHDAHHRACVTLPSSHPYSNSAGYQRLARFLIAEELGYLPRSDEHTHHTNGDLSDDRVDNLELVAVEYHGRLHASAVFVGRGEDGRFVERDPHDPPPVGGVVDWPRDRAVLGNQAKEIQVKVNKTLTIPCPACGAPRGEVCRDPTPEQISRGLPTGEVWTGRNRRSHGSRVAQLEHLEALKAISDWS